MSTSNNTETLEAIEVKSGYKKFEVLLVLRSKLSNGRECSLIISEHIILADSEEDVAIYVENNLAKDKYSYVISRAK